MGIAKHINNIQLYYTIKPFSKYNVVIKNVYVMKIEPEYYNTYSKLCDVTRRSFLKCYDALGKMVINKKIIENNLKSIIDTNNVSNINYIQGLEMMRRQSMQIKKINKKYNEEKNEFTIKIRVILYEVTKALDLLMKINMTERYDYKIKNKNKDLQTLEKMLFDEKCINNKSIMDIIKSTLWNIMLKDPLKQFDLKNQINNLKEIYLLKTINTLSKIKVYIINNLLSININKIIDN